MKSEEGEGDLIEIFKILKQHDQVDPQNFFIMREDATRRDNTRGHHLKTFKQRRKTVQRRKSISHRNRVVDAWNDQGKELRPQP